jgi:hypothetical protein
MKLFSLRLTTLKSKLYAIVFASFVVRVVAFIALPNTESNLAPDEGNYGSLTEWIAQSKPANEYPYASLYIISRSFIVPATLLNRIGLSGLDSVRLVASAYGLLTIILAVYLLLKLNDSRQEVSSFISKNQKKVISLLAIFALLPSHLIWSVFGLRETTMEFWVLFVFALVYYVFAVKKSLSKWATLGIFLAIPLVFSSRPQVGWVLGVTLLAYFVVKIRVRASQILIPITLIGIVTGYVATTAFSIETTQVFKAQVEVPNSIPSATSKSTPTPTATSQAEFNASLNCRAEGEEVIVQGVKYLCENKVEKKSIVGLKNPGVALLDQAEAIPLRHEVNKVDAASAIKTIACPIIDESRFQKYLCLAYRAPYTTYGFLVRPMLGADVTSSSSLFAAIENTFWLAAFLFVILMFIRNRRLAFFEALAPSLLFFALYSVGAGASEGNMGTAFRHKSLILWVVLLLIASTIVATQQRKAEQRGISGSSQE